MQMGGGLQRHFGRLTELWGLSQSIAVISADEFSVMGRHLCSLAVPSVLCLGQGNIMQALFSEKKKKKHFDKDLSCSKVDASRGK